MTNFFALIPARSGSKGLPGKNLRNFAGAPLISHTINFALDSGLFTQVSVSTDSKEIARISSQYGAEIPMLRPATLATDQTPMADVVKHATTFIFKDLIESDDYIVLLDPTSPVRKVKDLLEASSIIASAKSCDGLVSISKTFFNPDWVGVNVSEQNFIKPRITSNEIKNLRQEFSPFYRINGSFYFWKYDFAKNLTPNYLNQGKILGFLTKEMYSFSIDSEEDFELAELVYLKYRAHLSQQ